MSTARKFMFDLDFDAEEEKPDAPKEEIIEEEPEEEIPTFSEEDLERAREEGRAAGHEAGRAEAAEATEQRLLEAIEKAAEELIKLNESQLEANRDIAREMILVSTTIARKLFPDLNARNALGEVERVVKDTLKAITEEPRAQIILHPDLREPFMDRLSVLTHRAGFDGKVFVNPDPSLALGDCRIEWSNGTAIRDTEALMTEIDEIVERNLHDDMDDYEDDVDETEAQADIAADTPETEDEPAPETADTPESAAPEAVHGDETEMAADAPQPADDPESTPSETSTPDPEPGMATDMAPQDLDEAGAPGADEILPTPSFTPTPGAEDESENLDNSHLEQGVEENSDLPPTPHLRDDDGDDEARSGDDGDAQALQPGFTAPDPVSPEMTAAILDAQDDDSEGTTETGEDAPTTGS